MTEDRPRRVARRRAVLRAALVPALVAAAALTAPPPAVAADAEPCLAPFTHPKEGEVQRCPLWMPRRGYIPVHALGSGKPVEIGRLNAAGTVNWFICQLEYPGIRYSDRDAPQWHNTWWALTVSDDGRRGWVSEVYFRGGENDEADGGLRRCGSSGSGGGTPPAPPAPRDKDECVLDEKRMDQEIRVDFKLFSQRVHVTGEPPRVIERLPEQRRVRDFGRLTLRASTCRRRDSGRWEIVPPVAVEPARSADLEVTTKRNKREFTVARKGRYRSGYGIEVRGDGPPDEPVIPVQGLYCSRGTTAKGGLKEIISIPIKARYAVTVIQYLAAKALDFAGPDERTTCMSLGVKRLRLRASEGCVRVRADGGMRKSVIEGHEVLPGTMMEHRAVAPDVHYRSKPCKPKRHRTRPGRQP